MTRNNTLSVKTMILEFLVVAPLYMGLLFSTQTTWAGPETAQPKGYIQNDTGKKCWYKQSFKKDGSYFFNSLKGGLAIMIFDDPSCMGDSGLGQDVNKMMVNNVISRWYSHKDANFGTRAGELYPGSMLQTKGKCIQSKKYPNVGITIDYKVENGSIIRVYHGSAVRGCTK